MSTRSKSTFPLAKTTEQQLKHRENKKWVNVLSISLEKLLTQAGELWGMDAVIFSIKSLQTQKGTMCSHMEITGNGKREHPL